MHLKGAQEVFIIMRPPYEVIPMGVCFLGQLAYYVEVSVATTTAQTEHLTKGFFLSIRVLAGP